MHTCEKNVSNFVVNIYLCIFVHIWSISSFGNLWNMIVVPCVSCKSMAFKTTKIVHVHKVVTL